MAKREIRISIFYADQFVMDLSRHKKKLEEMIRLSNEFFGKYKLRIDSFPFPYNYLSYKEAFVLTQGQGIRPDVGQDQLAARMKAAQHESEHLKAETQDPNTTPQRLKELQALIAKNNALFQSFVWDGFNSTAEHDFRTALGKAFAGNKLLKKYAPQWKKAPRLTVVFCEFITLPVKSKTNTDTIGMFVPPITAGTIKSYKQFKKPVPGYRQPYVLLDIRATDWHSLAHEIVHGNGHVHPTAQYGDVAGYYDGPQESIMNYFSSGLKPSEVILEDADLKSLEQTFFVRG